MFSASEEFASVFPGAHAGFLALRNVVNPAHHDGLESRKRALEEELRRRFAGMDRASIPATPPMPAYAAYYRRHGKSYHVQAQLESVALKGRGLPTVAGLVEAMFMAEIEDMLLTAGHDLEALEPPVTLGVSRGQERYTLLRGQEQELRAGDMMMSDLRGVISSVLYGPDSRTQITPRTRAALFAVYAPDGVGEPAVRAHLERIETYVRIVSPEAHREALVILGAQREA